uniref:Calpain catalytic domain-containing protein n=1 Tax=Romanomermis culicivorax TaxID=13658 RepID=A0A915IAH4_ROMCU
MYAYRDPYQEEEDDYGRGDNRRGGGDPYEEGGGDDQESYDVEGGDIEEPFTQFNLHQDEFSGLIGNLAQDFLKSRLAGGGPQDEEEGLGRSSDAVSHFLGGGGGKGGKDFGDILGKIAGQVIAGGGGGGGGRSGQGGGGIAGDFLGNFLSNISGGGRGGGSGGRTDVSGGGGGGGAGGVDYVGLISNLIGGGGRKRDDDQPAQAGGGAGKTNVKGMVDDIMKGQLGNIIGGLIAGSGGKANRGTAGGDAGGGNIAAQNLKGGLIEAFSNLIGMGAHKFFGIDPQTGKILGAVAGNILFNLGGKDNSLGDIGKAVLDNILSGKFKRKIEPYKPVEPKYPAEPEPYRPVPRPSPRPPVEPTTETDFHRIRDACLQDKTLYEDPDFPASDSSLYFSQRPEYRVQWLRPGEICREPQLFIEGHTRFDVIQGKLGDCWLLAATACLTLRDELFYRVCPPDQSFTDNYAGVFHFQFWRYGKWVDVVIDDRLPCSNGELLYMHSEQNTEFWSALLEKAYAKLYGSYEALKGGTTSEALEDFTGGLTEFVDLKEPPTNLLQMLFTSFERGSLLACSIEADPRTFEARLPNGLVKGHAYSITGMKMVNGPRGKVALLRIRNPWGNAQEWNGAWSDDSYEWRSISDQEKEGMGLKFAHDGESWMSFDDFNRNFEKIEICHLGPEVMDEIECMTGAEVKTASWISCTKTFGRNPQILMSLSSADRSDNDGLCTVIVGLLQKNRREMKSKGLDMLPIGFAVYESPGGGRLSTDFFASHKAVARSPVFINLREICGRFRLPPGQYVVVPSTYEPDCPGDFMLRLFGQSESGLDSHLL